MVKRSRITSRLGFTLVELLVATIISALFLGAAFHVISALNRSQTLLAKRKAVQPALNDPLDILRWDLANARSIKIRDSRVALVGYGGMNFKTMAVEHHPVEIIYELRSDGLHTWLVRQQTNMEELTNRSIQTQPLLCGVSYFSLKIPRDLDRKYARTWDKREEKFVSGRSFRDTDDEYDNDDTEDRQNDDKNNDTKNDSNDNDKSKADTLLNNNNRNSNSNKNDDDNNGSNNGNNQSKRRQNQLAIDPLAHIHGMGPIPPRLDIKLRYDDGKRPELELTLYIRNE